MITGFNLPPRRGSSQPLWMDPEAALRRAEWPHLMMELNTADGGKTWRSSTASAFGRVSRVRFGPNGLGLGLIEFSAYFGYPSEVHRINWVTGASERMYRDKNRIVTDIAIQPGGTCYLAGVEAVGRLRSALPGKVKIMSAGGDLSTWNDMEVDYRAEGHGAMLASAGEGLWAATDTGMILKLEK
jgi:hypothetical protein